MIRPILAAVLMLAASRDDGFAQASFTGLGFLPGDTSSFGTAVSSDGKVIVGWSSQHGSPQAFRWTAEGGMVGLGKVPRSYVKSRAYAVCSNGSVIAGVFEGSQSASQAFRWTAADDMFGLENLAGRIGSSFASAISSNGSVVVGWSPSASGMQAFRWTEAGRMVGLGYLPGGSYSEARGISDDGSVIVGWSQSTLHKHPPLLHKPPRCRGVSLDSDERYGEPRNFARIYRQPCLRCIG